MNDEKMAYLQQIAKRAAGQGTEMLLALQVVTGFNSLYHAFMRAGDGEMAEIVNDLARITVATSEIPREVWDRAVTEFRKTMTGARMLDDDPMPPAAGGVQ